MDVTSTPAAWGQPNMAGVNFLRAELSAALTRAQIALQARNNAEKRCRNQASARKAHDTLLRFGNYLPLSEADAQELQEKLIRLRVMLQQLGESFRADGEIDAFDSNRQEQKLRINIVRTPNFGEALLKTQKLAVLGRMAAGIAHEINNPLQAAIGLVYLARTDREVPLHIKERLEAVEHELNRAALTTQSTLGFCRESLHPLCTNPVELVESILSFQQGYIQRAGIKVEKDLRYSEPLYAFPGELRQIVTNLVSNAVDAMSPKEKLVVRVHPAPDWRTGRDGYRILVADTGCGIPTQNRQRLFEAFYTTKEEKGTGLGLWITKQLVTKHGGFLKFRSRCQSSSRKGGTVFSVWLPLTHDFAPADDSIPHSATV